MYITFSSIKMFCYICTRDGRKKYFLTCTHFLTVHHRAISYVDAKVDVEAKKYKVRSIRSVPLESRLFCRGKTTFPTPCRVDAEYLKFLYDLVDILLSTFAVLPPRIINDEAIYICSSSDVKFQPEARKKFLPDFMTLTFYDWIRLGNIRISCRMQIQDRFTAKNKIKWKAVLELKFLDEHLIAVSFTYSHGNSPQHPTLCYFLSILFPRNSHISLEIHSLCIK